MLKVRNLRAGYGSLQVIKGVSLHVNEGEIVTLIGANGAGKTTLLNTLAGIIKPFSGSISYNGKDTSRLAPEAISSMGCVLIPEGRLLFSAMTIRENLILGAYNLLKSGKKEEADKELEEMFTLFPRLKEREQQHAGTLSGGEQQMLAIARGLMSRPSFIMMDEPSMGLAPKIVAEILTIITELRSQGKTILLVEQNARAALRVADRGYVMDTGSMFIEGSAQELLLNKDVQRAYLGKEYARINE
ncbi:MAG: ABC transporter ATP-binding protein [Spirochaetales bacterium]|nr:MAG: ABC transporter ATP-binding protein [Spirochaetales bacterium]